MAERVVLHVGCMKSGTSFLQRALGAHRDELAVSGVLFPGRSWRRQVAAVIDVRGHRRDGTVPPDAEGAWNELVAEIAAFPGTAVVSMEFLATTTTEAIGRIVDALRPARVDALLTVRDLGRTLPSMWQEGLKNGDLATWPDYLESVRRGGVTEPGPARRFWRHQAATRIARRWQAGADSLTLVTVPPSGAAPDLLWRRFGEVVGIEPDRFPAPAGGNESLGAASAELVRRLNVELDGRLATDVYHDRVKRLAKRGLAPRRTDEPAIGYPDEPSVSWVVERSEAMVEGLRGLDLPMVGDLDDLLARPRVAGVGAVPEEDVVAAAVDGLAHVLLRAARA